MSTPDAQTLVERLRTDVLWHKRRGNETIARDCEEAAAEIERLRADAANLRTVMIAAAEEIAAYWDAHCDAEGYGPVNLQRRLAEGIPSEYGYTAGAFAKLQAQHDAVAADAERYQFLRDDFSPMGLNIDGNHAWAYRRNATLKGPSLDSAIDAAMRDAPNG